MSAIQDTLSDASLGEVTTTADALQVVFHRHYKKPIEKVWAAVTTPERLADWLAEAEIEMKVGGRIRLNWNKGLPSPWKAASWRSTRPTPSPGPGRWATARRWCASTSSRTATAAG